MRKIKTIISVLILMLLYTSCSSSPQSSNIDNSDFYGTTDSSNNYNEEQSNVKSVEYNTNFSDQYDNTSYQGVDNNLPENQDFIVRIYLDMETKDFNKSLKSLEKIASDFTGYIENADSTYGSYSNSGLVRVSKYTLRIPKGKSRQAVDFIKSNVGNVIREEQSTENVTKAIKDLDRKINLLKNKEDRLIELSKNSVDIDTLIKIESEIANTISEREYIQAQLQNVKHSVKYDFLTINIQEVREPKIIESDSFIGDIKTAFRDSLSDVKNFFQGSILFFVRYWFNLIVLILFIIVVIIIFKKSNKKEVGLDINNKTPTQNQENTSSNLKSKYKK